MEKISEIGLWIAQIHQISDRLMEWKFKEKDLEGFSATQGRVLFILEQLDNKKLAKIPIQALVNQLKIPNSTFTQLLDRLEEKGLVERMRSINDRRKIHIQKNEENFKEFLDIYRTILVDMTNAYFRNISLEEQILIEKIFPKIILSLMEEEEKIE